MKFLILFTALVYLLLGFVLWEVFKPRPLNLATRGLIESLAHQQLINQRLLDLHRAQIGAMVSLLSYTESRYELLKKSIIEKDSYHVLTENTRQISLFDNDPEIIK